MNIAKPKVVYQAQVIAYTSLFVGFAGAIVELPGLLRLSDPLDIIFLTLTQVVLSIFLGILIYFIGKRKNWARYLLLIMLIIAVSFGIGPLLQELSSNPASGILELGQSIAETAVVIFLFRRPAREWFKLRVSKG